jgi:hypothetical protein
MFRTSMVLAAFVLFMTGCGDQHQAEVRRGGGEPPAVESHPAQTENPHGTSLNSPLGDMAAEQPVEATGPVVDLGSMTITAPEGWVRKTPRSGMVKIWAEFALPHAEGDQTDGRLTVMQAGGDVKGNIDRWRGQFSKLEKSSQEELKVDGKNATLVDFSGTYADQLGGGDKAGYRMLGAIIDADGRLWFVKAYGPVKTMSPQASAFRKFVESLKTKPEAKKS